MENAAVPVVAYVALGSNLGLRERLLAQATVALRGAPGIILDAVSPIFQTRAVAPEPQPDYLNAVVRIRTQLEPLKLLALCLDIERRLGRIRPAGQIRAARTIDLDVLLYGDQVIDLPGLRIPHPALLDRPFVRIPLARVALPGLREPQTGTRLDAANAHAEVRLVGAMIDMPEAADYNLPTLVEKTASENQAAVRPAGTDGDTFASMFAEFEQKQPAGKRPRVKLGDSVKARITAIGRDAVFLVIEGTQIEGVLDLVELRDAAGDLIAKEGDVIEARVAEMGDKRDVVVLRRSMRRGAAGQAELEQAYKLSLPVEGTVTAANKGGVDVSFSGQRGFCPLSQLDGRQVDDVASFIGRKMFFKITKYETDDRGINLIVSRRALLDEENKRRAIETRQKLVVGAILPGVVSSLRDFGAFIDLGGIDGLLPASEISFSRGVRPEEVLKVGQELSVQVLRLEKTEDLRRPEKITLSLKSLADDPWQAVVAKFPVGSKVRAKIMRLETFGAFAEIAPGIEGLIHIGEMGDGKQPIRHPKEALTIGDEWDVFVLQVDAARRRIGLGMREREDLVDAEGAAAAKNASGSLGTFADLLRAKLAR